VENRKVQYKNKTNFLKTVEHREKTFKVEGFLVAVDGGI